MKPNEKEFFEKIGGVTKTAQKDLPTISKLLSSVPKAMVISYIILSSAVTVGFCALFYYFYLQPELIAKYRKIK